MERQICCTQRDAINVVGLMVAWYRFVETI